MNLNQIKPRVSLDEDDEADVFDETNESQDSVGEEEVEEEEEEEEENVDETDAEEAAEPELSHSDSPTGNTHPYPTPPPEDAKTVSNGMQKAAKEPAAPKNKMAAPKKVKETGIKVKPNTVLGQSLAAIEALGSRSGSSVKAIVKYMKSNDSEITDERRISKLVNRALKVAIANGSVEQVKRSFKITQQAKQASKAIEKMKAKKQKEKVAGKTLEKEKPTKQKQEQNQEKKELKAKAKATERKTKQAAKKKSANVDTQPKAKAAAGAAAQAALEKPTPEAKPAKKVGKKTIDAETNKEANVKSKSKAKPPRKSIGTLTQPKVVAKVSRKTVKQLVAGKEIGKNMSGININPNDLPMQSSTPVANNKRKGRTVKVHQK